MANPELPSGYTAGQISITGGTAVQLGPLIQAQIDANAAMAAFQVTLQADAANAGPIFIGASLGVNATNYGFSLAAGADRQYGGGTGNNILLGRFFVFATASAVLHIEIFP